MSDRTARRAATLLASTLSCDALLHVYWPTADLDPVRRLRALAAGIPGAHVTEGFLAAPYDRVSALLGDLEGEFGRVVPDMRRLRVVRRHGERVEALARSRYGMRARLRGCDGPAGAGCRAGSC